MALCSRQACKAGHPGVWLRALNADWSKFVQVAAVRGRRDVQTSQSVGSIFPRPMIVSLRLISTEKEPGMFGTLVICLPSKHEGGDVVASHRGQSKIFHTSSTFDHNYISWYADVTHEVKPIISGHRLVLVYNLIQYSTGPTLSATVLAREKKELSSILSSWTRGATKENPKAPIFLTYQLDHRYTDASLQFQSLKGVDKVKAEYLREICPQVGVGFHLVSMERTEYGPCEDDYHEHGYGHGYDESEEDEEENDISGAAHTLEGILQESIQLKRMIDLDGSVIARDISIEEEDIVQEEPFSRKPDKEDFEDYTGNAGASATHFYHDIVRDPQIRGFFWLRPDV